MNIETQRNANLEQILARAKVLLSGKRAELTKDGDIESAILLANREADMENRLRGMIKDEPQ